MTDESPQTESTRTNLAAPPRWQRWPIRLALVGLGLLAALVLGELVARLCGRQPMQLDADYRANYKNLYRVAPAGRPTLYELKPGAEAEFAYLGPRIKYRVNEDGLRGPRRYARPKPAGVKRVLMLGDSVLFGIGAHDEELFSMLVEKGLPGVEVVNAGIGGYNTYTERMWLEAEGWSYSPDVLVLCYCPNDVDEPMEHFSKHTTDTLGDFPEAAVPNPKRHAELLTKPSAPGDAPSGGGQALKQATAWAMQHSALANACAQPFAHGRTTRTYERCLLAMADASSPEHAWLKREFEALSGAARQAGVPVVFVYLPLAYEVDAKDARLGQSRRNVNDLAAGCGFVVVDVAGAIAKTDDPYLDVSHLSLAGHRAVADVLVEALHGQRPEA